MQNVCHGCPSVYLPFGFFAGRDRLARGAALRFFEGEAEESGEPTRMGDESDALLVGHIDGADGMSTAGAAESGGCGRQSISANVTVRKRSDQNHTVTIGAGVAAWALSKS
jgi:hypothetical protein